MMKMRKIEKSRVGPYLLFLYQDKTARSLQSGEKNARIFKNVGIFNYFEIFSPTLNLRMQ